MNDQGGVATKGQRASKPSNISTIREGNFFKIDSWPGKNLGRPKRQGIV